MLDRARQKNLKLNKEKSQIALSEISYIGHILSKGLKPDPKKVQAITEMNRPQNKEDLQRFLGMITYVAKFIPKFSLVVTYRPGKELLIADTLSRAYLPNENTSILDEELEVNLVTTLPISENKLELIKYETRQDFSLQQLKQVVLTGWPTRKHECPPTTTPYWTYRDEISVQDDILFRGERVIIPT